MTEIDLKGYMARLPLLKGAFIGDLVQTARDAGELNITAVYKRDCPVCGAVDAMYQHGVISTGLPLEHYTPAYLEVLKNHTMWCSKCGFDQGS